MVLARRVIAALAAAFGALATAAVGAADLTIGIGADVTAIDPHYHNLTPNSNVAAHIFDYLVLRDERQKPIPGLAESWRTVDQTTWEFKLRKGVKLTRRRRLHCGRRRVDRTRAAGANSPSPFTVYTSDQKSSSSTRTRSASRPRHRTR
jgi:peptide/nickel transport system substrate-binding protein